MNIPAELRALLQIPNDAAAFVMAMFRSFFMPLRTIHNRVVTRTGIASVEIADADPKRAGNQRARITMRDNGNDPGRLAARVAIMIAHKGKGRLYVDEAVRWASGQPVGTSRSLDDDGAEVTPLRALDRRLMGARTLDPVTLTLIVGVGVPLLVAIIPGLLPMIIEWGRGAFTAIVTNSQGQPVPTGPAVPDVDKEFGAQVTAPFADVFDMVAGGPGDGDPTNDTRNAVLVGGVVVLAIYLLTR